MIFLFTKRLTNMSKIVISAELDFPFEVKATDTFLLLQKVNCPDNGSNDYYCYVLNTETNKVSMDNYIAIMRNTITDCDVKIHDKSLSLLETYYQIRTPYVGSNGPAVTSFLIEKFPELDQESDEFFNFPCGCSL